MSAPKQDRYFDDAEYRAGWDGYFYGEKPTDDKSQSWKAGFDDAEHEECKYD